MKNGIDKIRIYFYLVFVTVIPLAISVNTIDPVAIKTYLAQGIVAFYLCFLVLWLVIKKRSIKFNLHVVYLPLIFWMLWEIAGHFLPVVRDFTNLRYGLILTVGGLLLAMNFDRDIISANKKIIASVSIGMATVLSLFVFYQKIFPMVDYEYIYAMPSATLGNHNFFTSYILINLGLLFALYPASEKVGNKITWGVVFVLFFASTCVSTSRTGLFLFVLISVLFFAYQTFSFLKQRKFGIKLLSKKKLFISLATFMFLVLVTVVGFFNMENVSGKLDVRTSLLKRRLPIWQSSVAMYKAHPLFGWGTGSFRAVFPSYKVESIKTMFNEPLRDWETTGSKCIVIAHAHNEFLEVLVERGIIGLVFFSMVWVSFLFWVFKNMNNGSRVEKQWIVGLALGVTGILVQNLFTVTMRYASTILLVFFLVGFLLSLKKGKVIRVAINNNAYKFGLAFVSVVVSVFVLYGVFCNYKSDTLLKRAMVMINGKRYSDAMVSLKKAEKYNKNNPDIYYKRGYVAVLLNNYNTAVLAYTKTLSLEPNYAHAHYNLGCTFYKQKKYDSAKKEFLRSLDIFSGHKKALYYMVNINIAEKNYTELAKYCEKAVNVGISDNRIQKLFTVLKESGYYDYENKS